MTKHEYDANRNETKRTDAVNEVTTYTYDANGNQTSSTNVALERDDHDDLQRVLAAADDHESDRQHDDDRLRRPAAFRRVSRDSMGLLATFTSSEHGLPLTVTDAAGKTVYLSYDAAGNLTGRMDRLGRSTGYTYDAMGRKTSMTDPRGGVTSYSYDNDGDLLATISPASTISEGFGPLIHLDANRNVQQITTVHQYVGVNVAAGRTDLFTYDLDNHLTKIVHAR